MNESEAKLFIDRFSKFYLNDPKVLINEKDFKYEGLPKNLNRTHPELEDYITTEKIEKGIFDAQSFAWKAGKAGWENGHFVYIKTLPDKWVNGNGGQIKVNKEDKGFSGEDFENYLSKNRIDTSGYDFDKAEDRKKLYLEIKKNYNLHNYGTVYIINHMFFLSKGAVPIYDRFAHIALKALFMDKSPLEVYVPSAPLKSDQRKGEDENGYYPAVSLFEEYIWLLKEVFPSEIHKNGDTMFISRNLDQALWVYGHATRRWR